MITCGDTRYPEEIDMFKSLPGVKCITVNIVRPGDEDATVTKHDSESALTGYEIFILSYLNDCASRRGKYLTM